MIPSKVLLCGEYSVVFGGNALALPFYKYAASWKKGSFVQSRHLLSFQKYIHSKNMDVNTENFFEDIMIGWYFDSNIPFGAGLGSSASLVAGVYKKYGNQSIQNIQELKSIFSRMESFYHGSSSGFDPLVAYLQSPLLKISDSISVVDLKSLNLENIYLLETGIPRKSKHLIPGILESIKDNDYYLSLQNRLCNCLTKNSDVTSSFKSISAYQFENMPSLISSNLLHLWKKGLDQDTYYLKLCGAGGGGYYLIYIPDTTIWTHSDINLISIL